MYLDWLEFFGCREAAVRKSSRSKRRPDGPDERVVTDDADVVELAVALAGGETRGACADDVAGPAGSEDQSACADDLGHSAAFEDRGACADDDGPDPSVIVDLDTVADVVPGLAEKRTVSFWSPPDAARMFWASVDRMMELADDELDVGGCVSVMLIQFAHDNAKPAMHRAKLNREILERDGWQCTNPNCRSRRNLDVHHIQYRSRGGSDDPSNLTTLCSGCHRLVHDGFMGIEGPPDARAFLVMPTGDGSPPRERWVNSILEGGTGWG
jgi:hypothetical protein